MSLLALINALLNFSVHISMHTLILIEANPVHENKSRVKRGRFNRTVAGLFYNKKSIHV